MIEREEDKSHNYFPAEEMLSEEFMRIHRIEENVDVAIVSGKSFKEA